MNQGQTASAPGHLVGRSPEPATLFDLPNLLVAFPAGGALWLLFPFVALGARFGLLSPAAEAVVWPLLELSTKTCM